MFSTSDGARRIKRFTARWAVSQIASIACAAHAYSSPVQSALGCQAVKCSHHVVQMVVDRVSVEVSSIVAVPAEIESEADRAQIVRYRSGSMFVSFLTASLPVNEQNAAAIASRFDAWVGDATDQWPMPRCKREIPHHCRLAQMLCCFAHLSRAVTRLSSIDASSSNSINRTR